MVIYRVVSWMLTVTTVLDATSTDFYIHLGAAALLITDILHIFNFSHNMLNLTATSCLFRCPDDAEQH